MDKYDDSTYGDRISEAYDDLYSEFNPESILLLAELAGDGPALELGIGTGRIALPLRERGLEVVGIDASEAMIARLRAKEGGDAIEVTTGSFAAFEMNRRFSLIYVVFNTFFALLTQDEQVQCFQCVSNHLTRDGAFVMEAFVPDLGRFDRHQTVRMVHMTEDLAELDVSRHDPVTQQVVSQHILLTNEGNRLYPIKIRYAWPSELDLMARMAALTLRHRWSSWTKDDFTSDSGKHISVYGRDE